MLKNECYLLVDDTKLYHTISSQVDKLQLQEDLQALRRWSEIWFLSFHPDNCKFYLHAC